MACIRRINLDAFWSRATSTVLGNRDKVRGILKLSEQVGLDGPFEHTMALPPFDHAGYEVAIALVLDSTGKGKYFADHKQWDTVRKIRTVYSNQAKASPQQNLSTTAFGDDTGKYQRLTTDKCSSYWFSRFVVGCRHRMGQEWRPNNAMSIELILEVERLVLEKIEENASRSIKHKWIVFGTYFILSYVMSFRGVEGLLLDLGGLIANLKHDSEEHIMRGQIKGEQQQRCHVMPCCVKTSSGINVREWLLKLLEQMTSLGHKIGPAIADEQGNVRNCSQMDELFVSVLEELYVDQRNLFPLSIQSKEEIAARCSVFRSPRRSSDTRALEKNVSRTDIELVNRWGTVERAKGTRVGWTMYQHYAEVELLLEPLKRYTTAM